MELVKKRREINIKTTTQKHIALHTRPVNSGVFRCDRGNCESKFVSQSHLERHIRIHDNDLLHCHFCPWTGNTGLDIHLNHHFHNRPYKCSFCADSFYQHIKRRQHEEVFHEKIADRYKCDRCIFKTHSYDVINRHRNHKCLMR